MPWALSKKVEARVVVDFFCLECTVVNGGNVRLCSVVLVEGGVG